MEDRKNLQEKVQAHGVCRNCGGQFLWQSFHDEEIRCITCHPPHPTNVKNTITFITKEEHAAAQERLDSRPREAPP